MSAVQKFLSETRRSPGSSRLPQVRLNLLCVTVKYSQSINLSGKISASCIFYHIHGAAQRVVGGSWSSSSSQGLYQNEVRTQGGAGEVSSLIEPTRLRTRKSKEPLCGNNTVTGLCHGPAETEAQSAAEELRLEVG